MNDTEATPAGLLSDPVQHDTATLRAVLEVAQTREAAVDEQRVAAGNRCDAIQAARQEMLAERRAHGSGWSDEDKAGWEDRWGELTVAADAAIRDLCRHTAADVAVGGLVGEIRRLLWAAEDAGYAAAHATELGPFSRKDVA
jgi:hypothetical protein